MTNNAKYETNWYAGQSDELYVAKFDTRDEAVEYVRTSWGSGYICKATKRTNVFLSEFFDVTCFLENANENACEEYADFNNGDEFFMITEEQKKDLDFIVRNAFDNWQMKHKLVFKPWQFHDIYDEEYIDEQK